MISCLKKMALLCTILMSFFSYSAQNTNQTIFYDTNKDVAIQVELFEFDSESQRQGAVDLAKTLRCPQCQNQNLVESNSPIAKDLRLRVYQMIKEGKTDQQVIDYMTHRFGEFVLYDPEVNRNTLLLWLIPFALIVVGLLFAVRAVKKASNSG